MAKCFDGVLMSDDKSKLIIRILKSFSVRFVGDYTQTPWSISHGQFIIDIKSTHLVKFEEYALANLNVGARAKFYIDLELVEKLMLQGYSFFNVSLHEAARMTFYAKQITFIDFKVGLLNENLFCYSNNSKNRFNAKNSI